jgi:hypothetical protein
MVTRAHAATKMTDTVLRGVITACQIDIFDNRLHIPRFTAQADLSVKGALQDQKCTKIGGYIRRDANPPKPYRSVDIAEEE